MPSFNLNAETGPTDDPTYGALFELYIEKYARHHTKTWKDMIANHNRYCQAWNDCPISAIRRRDVQEWVDELAARKGKHLANRCHDTVRAVINWGIRKEYIQGPNPALGVDRYKLRPRERFVQPGDEFDRLARALDQEPSQTVRDFFWTCIFTGARKSNVMKMKWSEINFALGIWRIPDTKNGDSLTIPLTGAVLELLKRRKIMARSQWVFASDRKSSHLVEPDKAWLRIVKRAGIEDLHIHDLRRSLGSYMAIQGVSPTIIGKALGHRSLQATAVYARLTQDPVRDAMQKAFALMSSSSPPQNQATSNSADENCLQQENQLVTRKNQGD